MTQKLHIHLQSNPKAPAVFHMTRKLVNEAVKRNPAAAKNVEFTIATDKKGFYRAMKSADVLVGWWFPKYELETIAPNLKWIHVIGAGIEYLLPLDWLPQGVSLVNNKGVHADKAGEYVMMALLMLQNSLPTLVTQQRQKKWQEIYSTTIGGKTLLVVGVGKMGGAGAKRAKELGLRVLGVRRSARPHRYVDEMHPIEDLRKLIPKADFILITTPVTSETKGLFGKRELDLMRPEASLINFGRAAVVDYDVLRRKLVRREIKGAILDVFDPEPLPKSSPLWSTPNLIMTPHVGSDDALTYMPYTLDLALDNADRYSKGRPLKNRVIKSREY